MYHFSLDTGTHLMYNLLMERMNTKRTLQEAQDELRELLAQRAEIDRRIAGLGQIIQGLDALGEKLENKSLIEKIREDTAGFTDTVRDLIKHSPEPLTPMEIRDELERAGYGGRTPKLTLISVYTVLRRLKERKVILDCRKNGKAAYQYNPMQSVADALGF